MQTNFNFPEVTSTALEFLEKKLNYKYVTLRHYRSRWLFIKEYMESHKLDSLNPAVCRDYLLSLYDGRKHSDLSVNEKLIEKSIAVLSEFMKTGAIQKKSKIIYLDGPIGILMKDFLSFKESRRISRLTLDKVESHMSKFNFWLSANEILNISEIKETHIIGFLRSLDPGKKALIHDTLMDLRGFFTFLSDKGILKKDYALFIPKDNYKSQSEIPSYYTEDEIGQLFNSIDRGTSIGKRDYAILSLAAYLGLRASDIARLKFENIHWDKSVITLQQYKTGRNINHPLIPVVGNAILDYIQYGRPQSNEKNIFLLALSPYLPVKSRSIATMVNRRFVNSNLNIDNRRHGGHALRHSLVKELLNNKQALPVITEVLGHKSTASTRHYIRIDTDSLRQCALDVPSVDPVFYAQGGRIFFL